MNNDQEAQPETYVDAQIRKLKDAGVTFKKCTESEARQYMINKCFAFKLIAYAGLFETHADGKDAGMFFDLDFSQLVHLARIDQQLRDILLPMSLDVEHFCKTKLVAEGDVTEKDDYAIIADYKANLDAKGRQHIKNEIEKRKDNPYYRHIIEKYGDRMPLDAFVEVISFGTFLGVVYYCGKHRIGGQRVADYAVLHAIKSLRNACAHSACILPELSPSANGKRIAPNEVSNAVAAIGVSKRARRRWLRAVPIAQIASLLHQYAEIVPDGSTRTKRLKELNAFLSEIENDSVLPAKNPAQAALSFIKRLTEGFGLIE